MSGSRTSLLTPRLGLDYDRMYGLGEKIAGKKRVFKAGENRKERVFKARESSKEQDWQSGENTAQRDWQSGENTLNRTADFHRTIFATSPESYNVLDINTGFGPAIDSAMQRAGGVVRDRMDTDEDFRRRAVAAQERGVDIQGRGMTLKEQAYEDAKNATEYKFMLGPDNQWTVGNPKTGQVGPAPPAGVSFKGLAPEAVGRFMEGMEGTPEASSYFQVWMGEDPEAARAWLDQQGEYQKWMEEQMKNGSQQPKPQPKSLTPPQPPPRIRPALPTPQGSPIPIGHDHFGWQRKDERKR